ncbi:hypothetical protein DFS33DRAFT_1428429 [Desarmillaria ectypa]|nr:hypothetical protein DFS33DRAFT_1428429 [Desarmillaria ectypa]
MFLYGRLTVLNNAAFPATDVIESLIDILSRELCASNLQRSSHTFCTLISRSRDICDHVNYLIGKFITEDGWTSYDQYTVMIEPLEALLLSVFELIDTSRVETLTDTIDIDEWIKGAQYWNIDRKKVKDSLASAFSKEVFQSIAPTLTSEDTTHSWRHDDNVFLDNLIRGLERRLRNNKAKFSAGVQSRFTLIQSKLRDIQTRAKDSTSEACIIAIKSTILVNGMAEVTIKTTAPEICVHLGSDTVLSGTQGAISTTEIALQGAANLRDKASNRPTVDFENVQSSKVTNAYQTATAAARSSYGAYKASSSISSSQILETDANRLKAWKDRAKDKDMNKLVDRVEIVVKFKDEAFPHSVLNSKEQRISVPPTTQLDVILWKVLAHALPEIRDRVRSRSHLKTESPPETLSLSDPASKVVGRILLLTISA